MQKAKHILALATMAALPMTAASSFGAAYTWSGGVGVQNWSTGWTPAGGPVAAADTATIPPLGGNLLINVDTSTAILGTLTFGSTGFNTDVGNSNNTGNAITFNNTGGTGNASIITTGNGTNSVSAPIILLTNTDLNAASTTGLTLGSITASGGSRQINNNTASATSAGQTLTINGPIYVAETGAAAARGIVINGSGSGTTTNNGNVIINGAFNGNGVATSFTPVVLGTGNTSNGLVRSTITLNGDSSTFGGNITFSRANVVLTNDNNLGTGRILLGGSTNSVNAQISSSGGTRTIGTLGNPNATPVVPPSQLQIQQFNAFTGTNSFIINSRVFASASRGLGNLLAGNASLTLNNGLYSADKAADARNQIIDGSGNTVINGGLHNGYDAANNVEFAGALAGSYEKRGTGTLIVNGAATYTGGTRIRGGILEFGSSNAYGVGAATAGNGITVDAGGAVGLQTGSLDPAFLARIALGGGSNIQTIVAGGSPNTSNTDYTSTGALALTNNDTNTNISYAAGGNLSATFMQGLSLGAVSTGANYAGTITPAANTYRLGGGGTLNLTGSNQLNGANNVIANNGGTVNIATAQSYSGTTTIGGVYINPSQELLRLGQTTSVITNNVSLRANSTVSVASLANGGSNSSIGSGSSAASSLVVDGGTLQYTGAGSSTDRLFTVGANGATLDASGSGAMNFTNTGAIVASDAAGRAGVLDTSSKVTLYLDNANDLAVGMTVTGTGIAAGTTIKAIVPPSFSNIGGTTSIGPYQVILSASATGTGYQGIPDLVFGGQNRSLNLAGTSTAANTLSGSLSNSASGGTLSVNKTGTGTWALAGTNTYTGATMVSAGTLAVNTPTAISSASTVTVGGGTSAAVYKIGWDGTTASATIPVPTFAANGRFDIAKGRVVLTGTTDAAVATLVGDGGAGTGTVFTSSAGGGKVVGFGDVGAGGVTVRYTYAGDANLDGKVDFNDFLVLQNNYNTSGLFSKGDFNYNGTIDFNDFLVLQNNYGNNITGAAVPMIASQIAAMQSFAATVPEPTSLAVLGLGAAAALRRRRAR